MKGLITHNNYCVDCFLKSNIFVCHPQMINVRPNDSLIFPITLCSNCWEIFSNLSEEEQIHTFGKLKFVKNKIDKLFISLED